MNFLIWILFGALAGWIASLIMKSDGEQGTLTDIILGVLGSLVGNFVFGLFGGPGVTGFNIPSLLVAILGSIILIFIGRRLKR